VHGTECVTGLVGDYLPLLSTTGSNHNVGTGYSLCHTSTAAAGLIAAGSSSIGINSIIHTRLSEPGEANGSSCVASGEKGPVAVAVPLLATPGREQVETVLNVHTIAATLVPRGVLGGSAGALGVRDGQVGQAE